MPEVAGLRTDWSDMREAGELLLRAALEEDAASADVTTGSLGERAGGIHECVARAREELVLAGWELLEMTFDILASIGLGRADCTRSAREGERLGAGSTAGIVRGPAEAILRGERVALNVLSRMCGTATLTARYVEAVEGTGVEILDTRKTTPCMRALQRHAVRMGGGVSHRFDLSAMAMFKDNHLALAGGIGRLGQAVSRIRAEGIPVEIEVDDPEELGRALELGPDRLLLDNMGPDLLRRAVERCRGSGVYVEASGGVGLHNVRAIAESGVDGISVGALTHSAPASDIGLDWRGDA